MRRLAGGLVALLLAGAALAEDDAGAPGGRLLSAEEAVPFRAVGRVNIAGTRFCTGTLVAPDRVLTAAHCLYNPRTGAPVPAEEFRFVAGLRIDAKAAVRRVARVVPHPEFSFDGTADPAEVGADLALLLLAAPIEDATVPPLVPGKLAAGPVMIVSYARDRPQAPSMEAPCRVIAGFGDVLTLDCAVTYGVSGAPVLQGEGAALRVVGVISAMGKTIGGGDVALAARVEPGLDWLDVTLP